MSLNGPVESSLPGIHHMGLNKDSDNLKQPLGQLKPVQSTKATWKWMEQWKNTIMNWSTICLKVENQHDLQSQKWGGKGKEKKPKQKYTII